MFARPDARRLLMAFGLAMTIPMFLEEWRLIGELPSWLRGLLGSAAMSALGVYALKGYGRSDQSFLGKPQSRFYLWQFALLFDLYFLVVAAFVSISIAMAF
jgi:hypothetical protein